MSENQAFQTPPVMGWDGVPCDADSPSVYGNADGTLTCRCLKCARCGKHTGNSTQGHYWAFCKVTRTKREFHQCCPGDCELERV